MRLGENPAKNEYIKSDNVYHRILIPVYIPNLEGYYKESLEVLKLCLKSLYTTIHSKTKISIVSNGSCTEVNNFLKGEFESNNVDELYLVKTAIGKINALYKVINSVKEKLLTISDADVLFTTGWQESVEQLFLDYPKAGMICPSSYAKGYRDLTENIFCDNFFNKRIQVSKIKDPKALEHYAESIGNKNFYNAIQKQIGVVYQEKGKPKVFLGAGHFVSTFKKDVFKPVPFFKNFKKLSGKEKIYIDTPTIRSGLWRISTYENFVYHMGNTLNSNYVKKIVNNKNGKKKDLSSIVNVKHQSKLAYFIKVRLYKKLFFNKKQTYKFLINRGLTKKEALEFLGY